MADNTWGSGGAGKVSRKPEMEAEGGTGKTRAGGLQISSGPKGSPSYGPGAPLAESQPRSTLWSRLCISGLPSREDESEGLYVAVSMQNQGLHTTARKASGRDNKGISCVVSTGTWRARQPVQLLWHQGGRRLLGPRGSISESGLPPKLHAERHAWRARPVMSPYQSVTPPISTAVSLLRLDWFGGQTLVGTSPGPGPGLACRGPSRAPKTGSCCSHGATSPRASGS